LAGVGLQDSSTTMTLRKRPPATGLDAAMAVASPERSPHEMLDLAEARRPRASRTLSYAEQRVVLL
jgi:hypothetical protein